MSRIVTPAFWAVALVIVGIVTGQWPMCLIVWLAVFLGFCMGCDVGREEVRYEQYEKRCRDLLRKEETA